MSASSTQFQPYSTVPLQTLISLLSLPFPLDLSNPSTTGNIYFMKISHNFTTAPMLADIPWILYLLIIRFQWLKRWHLPGLEECPVYPDRFSRVELIIYFRQNSKPSTSSMHRLYFLFFENDGILPGCPRWWQRGCIAGSCKTHGWIRWHQCRHQHLADHPESWFHIHVVFANTS